MANFVSPRGVGLEHLVQEGQEGQELSHGGVDDNFERRGKLDGSNN